MRERVREGGKEGGMECGWRVERERKEGRESSEEVFVDEA